MLRLTALILIVHGCFANVSGKRSELLESLFDANKYNPEVGPFFETGNKTEVAVNFFITSIDSISETSMDYKLSGYLRQSWLDHRLKFDSNEYETEQLVLDYRWVKKTWIPDTFFLNEKTSHYHLMTVPNQLLRIQHDGTVLFSCSITLTLSCQMCFQNYPQDTQKCGFEVESYAHTSDQIAMKWMLSKVEVRKNLRLLQYELRDGIIDVGVKELKYSTGNWSVAWANFILDREIGYFVAQTYIPSILLVILSWVSFWLDITAVPARISLGILTVLTTTSQIAGIKANLPKVSYVKAIDIWVSMCLIFVVAAMLEYALVTIFSRRKSPICVPFGRTKEHDDRLDIGTSKEFSLPAMPTIKEDSDISKSQQNEDPSSQPPLITAQTEYDGKNTAKRVDNLARGLFPLSFIIFTVVYFVAYLPNKSKTIEC